MARQAAAPGPAMGGFTAATGTFHHSVRGAAAKQQFKFTLLASANSRVSIIRRVRLSQDAVSRARRNQSSRQPGAGQTDRRS